MGEGALGTIKPELLQCGESPDTFRLRYDALPCRGVVLE
jgi:hypothetical protein